MAVNIKVLEIYIGGSLQSSASFRPIIETLISKLKFHSRKKVLYNTNLAGNCKARLMCFYNSLSIKTRQRIALRFSVGFLKTINQ